MRKVKYLISRVEDGKGVVNDEYEGWFHQWCVLDDIGSVKGLCIRVVCGLVERETGEMLLIRHNALKFLEPLL